MILFFKYREAEFRSCRNRFALTSGLHDALQDHHNLKLLVHERALRQVKERALGVDLVADGER